MEEYARSLQELTRPGMSTVVRWLDILIVATIIYRLFLLVRGKRAWQIVIGVMFFVALLALSKQFHLEVLHWVLDKATLLGPVALVILFLPELRHGLEGLGRFGLRPLGVQRISAPLNRSSQTTVDETVRAVSAMASDRIGALIVFDPTSALDDVVATGVFVNAVCSAPLVQSIFFEGNPLHDGAVVIRGDRLVAAACRLPLSESSGLDRNVHMRHRAAVGVSEQHDCLAIAVSEERGTVSVAYDGRLRTLSAPIELREVLTSQLGLDSDAPVKRSRRRAKTGAGT